MSAMALRQTRDPLRPPEAPGLGRGIGFALLVHIALVVAISINVQWRTKTLPAFEAELWSAVPQAAAPKAVEPEPEPEPPKPEPKPEPVKGPTPEEIQAQRDAEIAVAKAKKEEQKKREAALLEEQKKLKALKEKQDKAERDKQDKLEKEKQDKLDKAKQDKLDKAAEKAADAKREAQRQENLRRMMGMAGASGGPTSTGTAAKSSGPSSSYGGRIVARVRPNIIYSDSPAGNPVAEVEVRAAPTGDIIGKKLLKSSGDPEWDKAVLRAIDKTEKLPTDVDGSVPSSIVISFRYRD